MIIPDSLRGNSLRTFSWLAVALLGTSCSQIVGFKDVTLEKGDGGMGSDAAADAMPDAVIDAMIDGPPPMLWVFSTSASVNGAFGTPNGARVTADIRCQDIYNLAFTARGCSIMNVHAVIQVDDVVDSIARMDITFPALPQGVELKRAADGTVVSANWDEFVNPNTSLLAPVSSSGTPIAFWSGRGTSSNMTCGGWTSTSGNGNAGDITKVNAWTNQSAPLCSSANQKLLCICW